MKWLCSICTLLIIACFIVGLFALLIFLDFETKAITLGSVTGPLLGLFHSHMELSLTEQLIQPVDGQFC